MSNSLQVVFSEVEKLDHKTKLLVIVKHHPVINEWKNGTSVRPILLPCTNMSAGWGLLQGTI